MQGYKAIELAKNNDLEPQKLASVNFICMCL